MSCPPYKLILCNPVHFVDHASIYPYLLELLTNGGFCSDRAGFTYSHSDRPLIRHHATGTNISHSFGSLSFWVKRKQNIVLDYRNTIFHIRNIELPNENNVSFLSMPG